LKPLYKDFPLVVCDQALTHAVGHVYTAIRSHFGNTKILPENVDKTKSIISNFFACTDDQQKGRDFPKASIHPPSVSLTEHGLLELLWDDRDKANNVVRIGLSSREQEITSLQGQGHGVKSRRSEAMLSEKEAYVEYILDRKGVLLQALFGTGQYSKVSLMSEDKQEGYLLQPGFQTDGLSITLLAHDLSSPKRK
ncbi:hypothetical protein BGZ73_002019, partial [Actinomortierella ambigua]